MTVLPNDIEAEKALLSCLLTYPKQFAKVRNIINGNDLYLEKHRFIFDALPKLDNPDIIALKAILEANGTFEKVGMECLASIVQASMTGAGASFYARRIRELSTRRTLATTAQHLFQDACNLGTDIVGTLSTVKETVRTIEKAQQPDHENSFQVLTRVFKDIETRNQSGVHHIGVLSGLKGIDSHLEGFEPKTLVYIIARPSIGKTALAISIGENFSKQNAGTVIFFSLEMASEAITRRRLSAESGVYLSRIRNGNIDEYQWPYLVKATDALGARPFRIFDQTKYKTIEHLISLSESIAMDSQICAIFIDHIQLMRSQKKFSNRHLEISFISNELKSLAKNLDTPVIALSQVNREIEKRGNHRPQLFDLKESGDLEADADIVLGLYREKKDSTKLEIAGLKGRDVGTWHDELYFNIFTQKIEGV